MRVLPGKLKLAAIAYGFLVFWNIFFFATDAQVRRMLFPYTFVLVFSPVVAYGLRNVRRWSYIALMVHAPTVIAIGVISLTYVPTHVVGYGSIVHALGALLFYLRPDIRAPYLAAHKRGFRRYRRFDTNLRTVVETPNGKRWGDTLDISAGGAYLHIDTKVFQPDQRVIVEIQLRDNQRLRVPARVVSVNAEGVGIKPYGIGIQFTSLTQEELGQLQEFISLARRHERAPLALQASFTYKGQRVVTQTVDVSMSGCYVAGDGALLQPGDRVTLALSLHEGDVLEVAADVIWLAFQDMPGKPAGAALQFASLRKVDQQRLRDRLTEAGALA